jgi:thiamine pyrophosphokinase
MRRAVIFANGEFARPVDLERLLAPDAYLIAVDGGTRHAFALGVLPHLIIGDLDSLAADDLARAKSASIAMRRFPPHKDETDLELALTYARDQGLTEIALLGAAGGRLDHALANIFLLAHPAFSDLRIRLYHGNQTTVLIRDAATISGCPGDLVSILPIGGPAVGVSNAGLAWPLRDETLPPGSPRGLSNVLLGNEASIRLRHGLLLCIVTRQAPIHNC